MSTETASSKLHEHTKHNTITQAKVRLQGGDPDSQASHMRLSQVHGAAKDLELNNETGDVQTHNSCSGATE